MTCTLHSQEEIYLRKEEKKGRDKNVQINLAWIRLVFVPGASMHIRCKH